MILSGLWETKGKENSAMAQPSPKVSIPVIPREFLERPRLRQRFDAALSRTESEVIELWPGSLGEVFALRLDETRKLSLMAEVLNEFA
jgi:hypothetical protein